LESVTESALDTHAGVDGGLDGDVVLGALVGNAAHPAVDVLGVLPDNDKVDVLGALAPEGALDAGVELHGAQVDVLVKLEAKAEQDAFLEDAGSDARVADGAEQN